MSPTAREINSPGNHYHQHQRPEPLKIHRDSHQISKQHQHSSSSTTTSSSNNCSASSSNSTISSANNSALSYNINNGYNVEGGAGGNAPPVPVQPPPQQQNQPQPQPQQQRQPVIIYTHSPKIIRTDARNFMALVQRLTGMSRPPPAALDVAGDNNNNAQTRPTASSPPGSPEESVVTDGSGKPAGAMDADSPPSAMSTNAVPMHVEPLAQMPPQLPVPATGYVDAMGTPSPPPPPPPPMPFFADIPLFTPNAAAGAPDFICSPLTFYNPAAISPVMDMRIFNDY